MNWTSNNTATALQGIGSLASAWGQYESDKKRTKFLEKQMDYEMQKDAQAKIKVDKAQTNLDDAFNDSELFKKKKKKDANGNEIVDDDATAIE